jgi:L-threonylcarbamoyladenylate synthase
VPGQHALHYSPRTPLSLYQDRQALLAACNTLQNAHKSCAALLIGEGEVPACKVIILPNQPEKVAEQLYSSLHELDAMKVDRLLVQLPPATSAWMAVLDRLTRAGHQ